jgi:ankyrin repeat protein
LKTALHWSTMRNTSKISQILLDFKPNFDAKDMSNKTPLTYVLMHNNYKDLIKFIMYGAKPLYFGVKKKQLMTGLECNRVL